MRAAVALRNVIGEAQHLLVVAAVPLHRHFHADIGVLVALAVAHGVEDVGVQNGFAFVDEINKTFHTARAGEIVFFAAALVFQTNAHAVVQETEFAQAFRENLVMEIVVLLEDFQIGQEMHFRTAPFGIARDFHRRNGYAVDFLDDAVLYKAFGKFQHMHFAIAPHGEAQHFGKRVHAAHAHAVQTARHFVAVLVEFTAGVQFGQRDFRRRTLGFVLIVHLDAGRNAASVIGNADGIVGMDGDHDVIAMSGQCFVDGVIDHFKHQMVQTRAVGRIADIHSGAFANRF